jgi:broad specificity phosphatase PhoE
LATLYLIRHGQASFGADNYDALSALGQEQAAVIGQWLHASGVKIDYAVAGNLARQQDTASIALKAYAQAASISEISHATDAALNEYQHDVIFQVGAKAAGHVDKPSSSMSRQEFQKLFDAGVKRWASGEHDQDYREPMSAFYERATSAIKRIQGRRIKSGETVVAFSSGGTIAMICAYALGLPLDKGIRLNYMIANGSITRFFYDEERFTLSYFNSHGHFEALDGGRLVSFR